MHIICRIVALPATISFSIAKTTRAYCPAEDNHKLNCNNSILSHQFLFILTIFLQLND